MRIIVGDSVRDTLIKISNEAVKDEVFYLKTHQYRMAENLIGFIKGLKLAILVLETERTVASLVGDNNVNRLSIKEREHHVQQRD